LCIQTKSMEQFPIFWCEMIENLLKLSHRYDLDSLFLERVFIICWSLFIGKVTRWMTMINITTNFSSAPSAYFTLLPSNLFFWSPTSTCHLPLTNPLCQVDDKKFANVQEYFAWSQEFVLYYLAKSDPLEVSIWHGHSRDHFGAKFQKWNWTVPCGDGHWEYAKEWF
jgi:hypothetical protein